MANVFQANGYHLAPSVIPVTVSDRLLLRALGLAGESKYAPGDNQTSGVSFVYADPWMERLLEYLVPFVEASTGVSVYPTYSYLRVYRRGDVLDLHTDRPACEISLSLSLGHEPDEPWPLWIQSRTGPIDIRMHAGDGVLFKGTELPHWREEFTGNYAAQVLLHYVDQLGPNRIWRFDKRKGLRTNLRAAESQRAADGSAG